MTVTDLSWTRSCALCERSEPLECGLAMPALCFAREALWSNAAEKPRFANTKSAEASPRQALSSLREVQCRRNVWIRSISC